MFKLGLNNIKNFCPWAWGGKGGTDKKLEEFFISCVKITLSFLLKRASPQIVMLKLGLNNLKNFCPWAWG